MTQLINKLRRLRVLQALSKAGFDPMGELAILKVVRTDVELKPTLERIRLSLAWLHENQLINLLQVDGSNWRAGHITIKGKDFLRLPEITVDGIFDPTEKPTITNDSNYRGRNSSINALPVDIKAWLDQELVERRFSGYRDLSKLLAEQGYELSKSAIGRYGVKFKKQQAKLRDRIDQAKAIATTLGADGGNLNQMLIALAQDQLLDAISSDNLNKEVDFDKLINSIANLNRSDINTRKFQIVQKARRQALKDATQAVERATKQTGMNTKDAAFIRNAVLGLR